MNNIEKSFRNVRWITNIHTKYIWDDYSRYQNWHKSFRNIGFSRVDVNKRIIYEEFKRHN